MRHTAVLATTIGALLLGACSGGQARIPDKGPMPEGGTYTGVYFSPQYGEMHLIQTGHEVAGWYSQNERVGRIHGTVSGNVMHFVWEEKREMVPGKPEITRGHGYFVYHIDHEKRGESEYEVHRLEGEWGMDNDETGGGPWTATKSLRRKPEPNPPMAE